MGAFNTVSSELRCPGCGSWMVATVQFKYGRVWQLHYNIGDSIEQAKSGENTEDDHRVLVEGVVEEACAECGLDDWDAYVFVEDNKISAVTTADGEFAFDSNNNRIALEYEVTYRTGASVWWMA